MSTQTTFDQHTYKADLRREWREAAPGWQRWLEVLEADRAMPQLGRWLLDAAQPRPGDRLLDVGTGYGEPGLTAARAVAPGGHVTLQDLSGEMLALARGRAASRRRAAAAGAHPAFREGDMHELPFADRSVSVITGAYAVRNAPDLRATIAEIRRVLRPGGRLALLEFSRSARPRVSALQIRLLRFWGRLWGRIIHRDAEVYGYIADSLAAFPHLPALEQALRETGFTDVRSRRYMFGLLAITHAAG